MTCTLRDSRSRINTCNRGIRLVAGIDISIGVDVGVIILRRSDINSLFVERDNARLRRGESGHFLLVLLALFFVQGYISITEIGQISKFEISSLLFKK